MQCSSSCYHGNMNGCPWILKIQWLKAFHLKFPISPISILIQMNPRGDSQNANNLRT